MSEFSSDPIKPNPKRGIKKSIDNINGFQIIRGRFVVPDITVPEPEIQISERAKKLEPKIEEMMYSVGLTRKVEISTTGSLHSEDRGSFYTPKNTVIYFKNFAPKVEHKNGKLYVIRIISVLEPEWRRFPGFFVTRYDDPPGKTNKRQREALEKTVSRVYNPDLETPVIKLPY